MAQSELASLTLFRATPDQVLESRKRTWPQWGGQLTKEQYLDRVAQMDVMERAVESRMITWVLAPRDDPKTLDFMCGCETYKRHGLVRDLGSTEVQEVTCYGVASVISGRTSEYNLPRFPVGWGAPPPEVAEAGNGMFSILYSDVGENFYKEAGPRSEKTGGWETRGPLAVSTIWTIPQEREDQQSSPDSQWAWHKHDDLVAFWERDIQHIRRTMERLPKSSQNYYCDSPKAFVSYLPDEGVGSCQIFHSMSTTESIVSMDTWGVEKKTTDIDHPTYAIWSIDERLGPGMPPALIITRIRATESEFPNLLRHIQAAARKSGIGKMEIWNMPKHLLEVAAETGGQTFERKKNVPAIKWYGTGDTADIEWILNEK